MAFLIFYAIVLSLYALINYYIFVRGLQAIPDGSSLRPWYIWIFWILVSTYVVGRILENIYISHASDVLVWTGSFWLGAMLYFFLLVVFFDLLRLINHYVPFFPEFVRSNYQQVKFLCFIGSVVLTGILILGGHINTLYPKTTKLEVTIPKNAGDMKSLKAVMMSDIHLGTLIGNGHLEKIVKKVNAIQPDIILLAGDVLDEDLEPVIRQNIGETLRQLKAPLGVYGVMGNHEHIGGASEAYDYLTGHGIKIIRDSVVKINESFFLVGREDRDKSRFSGKERRSLEELMDGIDLDYPVIMMDHQPFYLEKASGLGVDLMLSGHTHHGQLWPLNFITRAIYTISYGYGQIGSMHAYVSNGVGTWGPPVRVGNRPEIVELFIRFGNGEEQGN